MYFHVVVKKCCISVALWTFILFLGKHIIFKFFGNENMNTCGNKNSFCDFAEIGMIIT